MKKILKSKSGVVIESAILFLIVIFVLCYMIIVFNQKGYDNGQYESERAIGKVKIDQIGEDFLTYRGDLNLEYENYTYEVTDSTLTVWHENNQYDAVLYVELEGDNVVAWRYSQPD